MSLETLKQQPEVSVEIITGNKAYERVRVFLGNLKKTFPNRGALVGLSRESFNEKRIVFIASSASNDQGILVGEDVGGLFYASLMLARHSPEAYGVGEKLLDAANAKYEIIESNPYPVNSRENRETDPKLRRIHQNAPEHYYGKLGFVKGSTYGMGAMTRRRKKESL